MHSGEVPRQQGTAELLACWRRIRGKRAAPNRSDVDPARIRQVLCDSVMIEADSARHFPMRLAGARRRLLYEKTKGRLFGRRRIVAASRRRCSA